MTSEFRLLPERGITLSRRNLRILLNKLDRMAAGELTACAIIKTDDTGTHMVIRAVEDSVAYADREPGEMHPKDEAAL